MSVPSPLVETSARTDSGIWPSPISKLTHLIPIPTPASPDPIAAITAILTLISKTPSSPDHPLTMIGQLLIARHNLLHAVSTYIPPLFIAFPSPTTMTWPIFLHLCDTAAIPGVVMLDTGRRANVWFRDGPGDPSTPNREFVTHVISEMVEVASLLGSGSIADGDIWIMDDEADYSRSVFFSALDTRYADIVESVAVKVYREPDARRYVFPDDVKVDEEEVKVGVEWNDENGEKYFMDRACPEDFQQIDDNVMVKYHHDYHKRAISTDPFLSMSRVARSLSNAKLAASWCLTHINLIIGMTSTAPSYRRKGLATRVCKSLALSHREWLKENAIGVNVLPQCYVFVTNEASRGMFMGIGFVEERERRYCWMAVNP